MSETKVKESFMLGLFVCLGLIGLGYILSQAALQVKALDRVVTVKGLAEREITANIAIWPITFKQADNDLARLYAAIEEKIQMISHFLQKNGFTEAEITVSPPAIIDKQAQNYGDSAKVQFRYVATTSLSVYSNKVDAVRETMKKMVDLGKEGLVISGQEYQKPTEFLFTGLNQLKPQMIEEATKNARLVAEKFAKDSASRLGKIKSASQGQFSIENRDSSTPHIKKIRVVSTVTYYLSD